jgi:hypothetical protein
MSLRTGVGIGVFLIGIVVAGCGGGGADTSTVASTQANETTHDLPGVRGKPPVRGYRVFERNGIPVSQPRNHHYHAVSCRNGAYGDVGSRYPGSIRGAVGPPYVGPEEMWDETNMWWASDCHIFTVVTAGSDGDHHADGALVIQRTHYENPSHPQITEKKVNVPSGGILEITKAPLGSSVETWAQRRGNIEFKSEARGRGGHRLHAPGSGITGTLHLSDDTVTLKPESGAKRLPPCRPGGHDERFHGRLLPGIPDGLGATAENLGPQTNMSLMHVCQHFTAVGAGADPDHRADGRFTIYRRGERPARGTVKTVEVPGAGALTITKAPLGRKVVTRGQEPDAIQFKSKSGITGTLHLSDDTVALNP